MEFLFDTVNLEDVDHFGNCFPYTGVTSNPSIIKAEGKIDFFNHFRQLRRIIGKERSLHIQILASSCEGILKEADAILTQIDKDIYIKIPTNEAGLEAMQILKKQGVGITATAIYSKIQGFMAINAGADFIAPYYNRMENLDIEPVKIISSFAKIINSQSLSTKILAASFKNITQVNNSLIAGAQAVTLQPSLLREVFGMAAIKKAVEDFEADWKSIYGEQSILDMTLDYETEENDFVEGMKDD